MVKIDTRSTDQCFSHSRTKWIPDVHDTRMHFCNKNEIIFQNENWYKYIPYSTNLLYRFWQNNLIYLHVIVVPVSDLQVAHSGMSLNQFKFQSKMLLWYIVLWKGNRFCINMFDEQRIHAWLEILLPYQINNYNRV